MDMYNELKNVIIPMQKDIEGIDKDLEDGTEIYHHPQELRAMIMATKNLCEFILERGMKYVEIEKGQQCVQVAITTCRRYASVATKAEQKIHDFEDTIFFLQWLLVAPSH